MRDQLHSEIDRAEKVRNAAKAKAEKVFLERLADIIESAGEFEDALIEIAGLVGEEQDLNTAEAFQLGRSFAAERDGG